MRTLLLALIFAAPASAQIFDVGVRYELGLRLRMFEAALEKHRDDPKAIKRAIPPVAAATPAFFSGELGKAAAILDKARLTLPDERPAEAMLWASSLRFRASRRVAASSNGKIMVRVERFYPTKLKTPENAEARLTFGEDHHVVPLDGKLPVELLLEWKGMPEGERLFLCSVKAGKSVLLHIEQPISVIDGLEARLTRLDKSDLLGKKTVEGATLAHHLGILKKLARSDPLETDYPAHRLLVEAEAIAAGKWDNKKPGQYWLALPGVTGSPVRIFVPKEAARGKPLPVVVAMHGAGGSENMFFDGYGNGLVAKLAAERGWFVLATRAGFLGGPDVPAALDALAKIHPLDLKKAFIIGHSMGAAQGVSSAGRNPERFVAVAALGGGGSFKASNAIKKLPFFVGVGEKDIAVKSGASLAARLRKAGVDARFKEYPDLEHLTVVQMALPEVFRFFDRAVKGE